MAETPTRTDHRRRSRLEANPLLIKELRGRMRGARAFVVLTVYLLLLSCFASAIYYSAYSSNAFSPGGALQMADLGKSVFAGIVLIEIFMVTFITPAFTSGAICGERERKTYELLRATLLPAHRIVAGKLGSALTYVLLLILAAVPLEGLAFLLGGVVVEELVLALAILVVTAVFYGVLGLLLSSLLRTTLASTVVVYAVALVMTIGLPVVLILISAVISEPVLYGYGSAALPVAAQAVLFYVLYVLLNLSPIAAAVITEIVLVEEGSTWIFWMDLASTRVPVASAWLVYAAIYIGLALILLLLTVLRVRRQEVR